jgi:hypothetical protein
MIAPAFADMLQARGVGVGRWMARCPAHPDRNPSLSIAEGHDGRTLVLCRAGCATKAVVTAMGLSMRDLYAGPSPSPTKAKQIAAERARRDTVLKAQRQVSRLAFDRIRKLAAIVDALGDRLVRLSDDEPQADAVARLFHVAVERLRHAESDLEVRRAAR